MNCVANILNVKEVRMVEWLCRWLDFIILTSAYIISRGVPFKRVYCWHLAVILQKSSQFLLHPVEHNAIFKHDGLVNLISRNSYPCFLSFYCRLTTKISYSFLRTKGYIYILYLEWMWKSQGNAWHRNVSEIGNWWFV